MPRGRQLNARANATHWSTRSMGTVTVVSATTFKLSTDPVVTGRVRNIAELCLDPPIYAMVLLVSVSVADRERMSCRARAMAHSRGSKRGRYTMRICCTSH